MGDKLSARQLSKLVLKFYGKKASSPSFDPETKTVRCILYETYAFSCELDYLDRFGASIALGGKRGTGQLFGEVSSMNSKAVDIEQTLGKIDYWCRLHLPDAFLDEFDAL